MGLDFLIKVCIKTLKAYKKNYGENITWSCAYSSSNMIRKSFCPHFYQYLCIKEQSDVMNNLSGVWAPSWQSRRSKGGKGGGYEDKIWCELLEGQLLNWQSYCISAYASARLNAENRQRCLDAGTALHFGKKSIQIFSLKNIFNTWRHDNRMIEIDVLDGDSTCSGKCSSSQFGLISIQNEREKKPQHCLKSWCVWTTELLTEVPVPYLCFRQMVCL